MRKAEVLQDYRNDWVERSLAVENTDYDHIRSSHIFFLCGNPENELNDCMDSIMSSEKLRGVEFVKAQMPSEEEAVWLIWDLKDMPLSPEQREKLNLVKGKIIYVCDNIAGKDIPENWYVILIKRLYGAGLESIDFDTEKIEEQDTGVLDFFGAQMFLLGAASDIPVGIYDIESLKKYGYSGMISFEDALYMLNFYKNRPEERFYFDNTYDGDLQLLHNLLYMCLDEFDRICREYDIKYFLGGGTLLGAVRHKGIIPWDDDVDVMMLRDEYEKFIAIAPKAVREGMFFQSSDTDSDYHSVFPKLRIDGTRFVTEFSSRFPEAHQGIFIDIFVHDHTSDKPLGQKLHVYETLFARSMVFHKWEGTPMHFYGKLKLICRLATGYIRRKPMKKLEKLQDSVIKKYNKKKTSYLYDGTGEHLRHGAFPAKWLAGSRLARFGEKEFPIPVCAEEYLKYSYGDYEKWMPASLRKAEHNIVEVDFGKYKENE